jgi:hypothetical protein
MAPFNLPQWRPTPHIANSRMQIAPTPKASVASDNTYVQSIPAMGGKGGLGSGPALDLDQVNSAAISDDSRLSGRSAAKHSAGFQSDCAMRGDLSFY